MYNLSELPEHARIRKIPPGDNGGLFGINDIDANFFSLAKVVSSSDAIHVLRSIHRHALQYSIEMCIPSVGAGCSGRLLESDGERDDDMHITCSPRDTAPLFQPKSGTTTKA